MNKFVCSAALVGCLAGAAQADSVRVEAHFLEKQGMSNAAFSGEVGIQENGCIDLYAVIPDQFKTHTDLAGFNNAVRFKVGARYSKPVMVHFASPGRLSLDVPIGEGAFSHRSIEYKTPWGTTASTHVESPLTGDVYEVEHLGIDGPLLLGYGDYKPVPGCTGMIYTLENIGSGRLVPFKPGGDLEVSPLPIAQVFAAGEKTPVDAVPDGLKAGYWLHGSPVTLGEGDQYPFEIAIDTRDASQREKTVKIKFYTYFDQSGYYRIQPLHQSIKGLEYDVKINGLPLKRTDNASPFYDFKGGFYAAQSGWYLVDITAKLEAESANGPTNRPVAWSKPTYKHNGQGYKGLYRLALQTPSGTEILGTERMFIRQ